jgi:hypothetical protein
MRRTLIALTLAGAGLLSAGLLSQPAHADPYRWCAEYGGGRGGGGTNCYFVTLEQCRAAISGNGGFCRHNAFYTGSRSHGKKSRNSYGMSERSYSR